MAKNWTMAEAIKAIANQNAEDVKDIYRRFPVAGMLITKVVAGDTKAAFDIIANLPEWATVNKFEKALKADVPEAEEMDEAEDDAEAEDEVAEEKPAPKAKKSEKVEKSKGEKLTGGKAYEMVKSAGKLKDMKAKGFGTKAADYIAYVEKYGPFDSDAEDDADAENDDPYAVMTAQELFKECKKRGIEVKPKKPNKYYIDLLTKFDSESDANDDADDDWDEKEVVEEKPKAKKPEKKAEPVEDDDDEDWDI